EDGKEAEHCAGIGDGQEERLWCVPQEFGERMRLIRVAAGDDARAGNIELHPEPDKRQPADELNGVPVIGDGARDRSDAERRAEGDQPVSQHRACPRRDTAPEAPFDRTLDAEHVHRPDGRRHKDTYEEADGDDERIWYELHQSVGTPAPALVATETTLALLGTSRRAA